MNILALDASSTSGSIAISKNSRISFSIYLDIRITHSERLMPQIDFGLKQCQIEVQDLDLICLGNGPGSFTGIRIGLATAKGLCMGNNIPLKPFNTLEMLAYNVYGHELPVLTLLDAKMEEVYAALYSSRIKEIIPPQNAKPIDFLNQIKEKVVIVGDGAIKYKDIIDKSGIQYELALPHQNIPLASSMISMIQKLKKIPEFDFDFIANLEPYYLRKSQAELAKFGKKGNR